MKRRQLIRYLQVGAIATTVTGLAGRGRAQSPSQGRLEIEFFGHTCFRFTGGGRRVLTNPFRPGGCTAGYPEPNVEDTDVVLVSSFLLDEGDVENVPENKLLFESGIFQLQGMRFEGIPIAHDRLNGRRFGTNMMWRWQQGGLNIVHLGGAAAPIGNEQRILLGRPDVALIPVGGGDKAYNPEEAKAAIDRLNPRIIIPTHYRTAAADDEFCDIKPLEDFLNLMGDTSTRQQSDNRIVLTPQDLPQGDRLIQILTSPLS
ncbi:MBL fold metallo-hydrolase [Sodalinema gerasimenkoae]|uniref:MBL fold metallo-hydrolase n=1 Tax=Sodalinema gerasimenkoae TaxID=2862348 RepID=UPI00135AD97A|nr:MBL fold metallo-hydrolase [Sodalinema gerasimenkoae]